MHFHPSEYQERTSLIQADLQNRQLDGILLFAPESHYYLSGYDTFGFAMFQCMVLPATGEPQLLTRAPDLRQAQHTSNLGDSQIHIWVDSEDTDPYQDLLALLGDMGLLGKRLGIETQTPGLTAWNGQQVTNALQGQVVLEEASDVVRLRRRNKSDAELDFIRRAAQLSDDALLAATAITGPGAFEGDILAAMQGAVFKGGGDYAGNEFIIGSGPGALLCRYFSGRRTLSDSDQLTLEWSGALSAISRGNDAHIGDWAMSLTNNGTCTVRLLRH